METMVAGSMTPSRPPTAGFWFYFYFTPPASLVGLAGVTR